MKTILAFSILFLFMMISSSGTGITYHNKPVKANRGVCCASKTTQADSIPDSSIKINGKLNTVKIITDSIEGQNIESKTKSPNDFTKIEINGESNSVLISQKNGGKVNIIQNGTQNQIKISQSEPSYQK